MFLLFPKESPASYKYITYRMQVNVHYISVHYQSQLLNFTDSLPSKDNPELQPPIKLDRKKWSLRRPYFCGAVIFLISSLFGSGVILPRCWSMPLSFVLRVRMSLRGLPQALLLSSMEVLISMVSDKMWIPFRIK